MFQWFVVVRVWAMMGTKRPPREIMRTDPSDDGSFTFQFRDVDGAPSNWGSSDAFKSEAAARRYYADFKERDGAGSSIHLFLTTGLTRRGAAKKGVQKLLSPPQAPAELLESSRRPDYDEQ